MGYFLKIEKFKHLMQKEINKKNQKNILPDLHVYVGLHVNVNYT